MTYRVLMDCCTGQCAHCRDYPPGTKLRVIHCAGLPEADARRLAVRWHRFNPTVEPDPEPGQVIYREADPVGGIDTTLLSNLSSVMFHWTLPTLRAVAETIRQEIQRREIEGEARDAQQQAVNEAAERMKGGENE